MARITSRDVPCPTCPAEPGEQCWSVNASWKRHHPMTSYHPLRVAAAREARAGGES
jgi:hypothetical protein